ncbi:MAG TPA: type II toxin-antitoxin system RelE/ParE family toxin [Ignavibacteria bacterium]|nr:type II toxin-antitoxin system RelE/ParE family toxin [Ignavibacteria bacterium]
MGFNVFLTEDVVRFIDSVSIKAQAKIERSIQLLREFGHLLPMPHSKQLVGSKKLKELRVILGKNIYRLFYFHYREKTYIVTSGYIKKSPKTNKKEIEKALSIMNRILEQADEKNKIN